RTVLCALSRQMSSGWSLLIEARQPAQQGCTVADRKDRNVRRGLGGLCSSRPMTIILRSFDPFLESVQQLLGSLLRRRVAFVCAFYDRPQAAFNFLRGQLDIREHEPEEGFRRR